eukprot:scaffold101634_cov28-Tisochrysis_lutea.AAC.4
MRLAGAFPPIGFVFTYLSLRGRLPSLMCHPFAPTPPPLSSGAFSLLPSGAHAPSQAPTSCRSCLPPRVQTCDWRSVVPLHFAVFAALNTAPPPVPDSHCAHALILNNVPPPIHPCATHYARAPPLS